MSLILRFFKAFDIVICMTVIVFTIFICYIRLAISFISMKPHDSLYDCIVDQHYTINTMMEQNTLISQIVDYRTHVNRADYDAALVILDSWITKMQLEPLNFALHSDLLMQKYFLLMLTNPDLSNYLYELEKLGIQSKDMLQDLTALHCLHYKKVVPSHYKSRSILSEIIRAI